MSAGLRQEDEDDMERVKVAVANLGEHFDTVQVFVTKMRDDGRSTIRMEWGAGNWFARYGHVGYWMEREKEAARKEVRGGDAP